MRYKEGICREQISFLALEDMVDPESLVRIIDRFIELVDLKELGFNRTTPAATGRLAYSPQALAKLYVYGYENGIRSSRKLERETRRNLEVMWLVEGLRPDYKTISEFRRENIRPLQKLFREFMKLCKSWEMIGGDLFAVDGTKAKASNNKKNNFSRKKLEDRLKRIDEKIQQYLEDAEKTDNQENVEAFLDTAGLRELLKRKELYENYLAQIERSGVNEISTVDPDARMMGNSLGGVHMAYNVQSAVDGKHHLVVEYDVSLNPADQGQLGKMVRKIQQNLKLKRFIVLADKGYYNGKDLQRVKKYKVTAIVARQKASNPKDQPEQFHSKNFKYDEATDTYLCPMGKTLSANNQKSKTRRKYFNKIACQECPHHSICCIRGKAIIGV